MLFVDSLTIVCGGSYWYCGRFDCEEVNRPWGVVRYGQTGGKVKESDVCPAYPFHVQTTAELLSFE